MAVRTLDHLMTPGSSLLRRVSRAVRGILRVGGVAVCVVAVALAGCAPSSSPTSRPELTPSAGDLLPALQGVIQEFAIPTPQNDSYGITTGPDGNLWFTESKPYRIGRITPDGALTEFALPRPPNASPFAMDIVTGPDGNLWFTVVGGAGMIGRITPQGKFTAFPLPSPNADPIGIVAESDGALWFTEGRANRIGRITTSGVITEYPVPTAEGYPWAITSGPNNTVWFTERIGKVGKIS